MNVLFLAAGQNYFEPSDGGYPLCLTEFSGTPLIEKMIASCVGLPEAKLIFAIRAEDVRLYHLDHVIGLLAEDARIISVSDKTAGAACTALLAVEMINTEDELLILNANEMLDIDYRNVVDEFKVRQLDAGIVTFSSVHPRYSYVRLGEHGWVVEAAEKKPISRNATVGFYWYRKGSDFVRAVMEMIRKDAHLDGNFYICPSFNELVLAQMKIGVYQIESDKYHPLKTERQIQQFVSKS